MSDGLKTGIEIAICAVIAALIAAASAYVTHAIDAKKIATLTTSYANQESARNKQLLADYVDAVQARDVLQKSADAAALDAANQMKVANDKTEALRTCINNGSGCGLRIHVTANPVASASGAAVPEAVAAGDAEYAELAPDARSAYFALRSGIIQQQGQIAACQAYAKQMQ